MNGRAVPLKEVANAFFLPNSFNVTNVTLQEKGDKFKNELYHSAFFS
jgi:hypothetical protein